MKKLLVIFAAVLVLSGCSNDTGSKLEETTNVATINGDPVTSGEVYELLLENGILAETLQIVDEKILTGLYPLDGAEYITALEGHLKEVDEYYTQQTGKDLETLLGENDLTLDEFKELIKMDVLRELAVSNVAKKDISDADVQNAYDKILPEIKASHILITPKMKDDEGNDIAQEVAEGRALEVAKSIIEKLDQGETFADLAKEFGEDGTKDRGGDLGFFTAQDMVKEFSDAAFALELGAYTAEPVKTQFGYHVILKTEVKEKESIEDLREGILSDLIDVKIADEKFFNLTMHQIRLDAGFELVDTKVKEDYEEYIDSLKSDDQ